MASIGAGGNGTLPLCVLSAVSLADGLVTRADTAEARCLRRRGFLSGVDDCLSHCGLARQECGHLLPGWSVHGRLQCPHAGLDFNMDVTQTLVGVPGDGCDVIDRATEPLVSIVDRRPVLSQRRAPLIFQH